MKERSSPGLKGVEATFRQRPLAFRTITFYWIVQIAPFLRLPPSPTLSFSLSRLMLFIYGDKAFRSGRVLFPLRVLPDRGKYSGKRCFGGLRAERKRSR